jgi:hypothetical protein
MNTCPVCGYDRLTRPPADFYICPCCGTEFGNDDFETSHAELRGRWLRNHAPWFSRATPPPPYWNAYGQLRRAGLLSVGVGSSDSDPSFIDLGRERANVAQGVDIYKRLVAIGNAASLELLSRVRVEERYA